MSLKKQADMVLHPYTNDSIEKSQKDYLNRSSQTNFSPKQVSGHVIYSESNLTFIHDF